MFVDSVAHGETTVLATSGVPAKFQMLMWIPEALFGNFQNYEMMETKSTFSTKLQYIQHFLASQTGTSFTNLTTQNT